VVVVIGLFTLLTVLLADFLLDLTRASGLADVRAGLQSESLLHSEAILATLRKTTLSGLAVRSEPANPGFAATALETITTSGQRVWAQNLKMYYWQPGARTLFLQEAPPIALPAGLTFRPSHPPELSSAHLSAMFQAGRPLSDRVSSFEVALNDDNFRFRMVLEQTVPNGPTQRCETVREMNILSP
jgi:hypothetical protein